MTDSQPMRLTAAFVVTASLLVGCRTDVVPLVLKFNVEHAFLVSPTSRVVAFEVTGPAPCNEALSNVRLGNLGSAVLDSGAVNSCAVYNGEVFFENVSDQELVFVALSYDDGVTATTEGCVRANPHRLNGEPVTITQSVTEHYVMNLRTQPAECPDSARLCNNMCD